jgi:hypothetical protein
MQDIIKQVPAFGEDIAAGVTIRANSGAFSSVNGKTERDVIILEVASDGLSLKGVFFNPDTRINQNFGKGFGFAYGDFLESITIKASDVFRGHTTVEILGVKEEVVEDEMPPEEEAEPVGTTEPPTEPETVPLGEI